MAWVSGPFAIVAAVLAVGGAFKLRAPQPAGEALARLAVPGPRAVARIAGPVELAVGVVALVVGTRLPALAVAVAFALFTALTVAQLRRGEARSCGCFGRLSARPSPLHAGANATAAAVAAVAAALDAPGLLATARDAGSPAEGAILIATVAVAAALAVAVLTVLPTTLDATRSEPAVPDFQLVSPPR